MTASRVSRILTEGGLTKASRYKPFGRDREGFEAFESSLPGGAITVAITATHGAGRVYCDKAAEILTEAGIEFDTPSNNGSGGHYCLRVRGGSQDHSLEGLKKGPESR